MLITTLTNHMARNVRQCERKKYITNALLTSLYTVIFIFL